jgi:rhodanese-related sulfurtransferase
MEWVVVLVPVIAVAFLAVRPFVPVKGVTDLSAEAFREKWLAEKNGLLVDVREQAEYRAGHIPKAVNMPLSRFDALAKDIPGDRPVFLYCQSGMRSKMAAKRLAKNGHAPIYNLKGGVLRWPDRLA